MGPNDQDQNQGRERRPGGFGRPKDRGRSGFGVGQYFATAFTSALTLAFAFFIGFYGGQWLDRRFGTYPWLTLIGLGLGVTAGFRTVLREIVPDLFAPRKSRPGPDPAKEGRSGAPDDRPGKGSRP
ncbi:MAG TPA: AtpZ/AtpI family protein [Bacillota bacterium]